MSDDSDDVVRRYNGARPMQAPAKLLDDAIREVEILRKENARLREALLFAELMASEMGVDPREKCQRIYDELYKIRAALAVAERVIREQADNALREENARLQGLLREAHVKMEANNLWSNLRHRVAAAIREGEHSE